MSRIARARVCVCVVGAGREADRDCKFARMGTPERWGSRVYCGPSVTGETEGQGEAFGKSMWMVVLLLMSLENLLEEQVKAAGAGNAALATEAC